MTCHITRTRRTSLTVMLGCDHARSNVNVKTPSCLFRGQAHERTRVRIGRKGHVETNVFSFFFSTPENIVSWKHAYFAFRDAVGKSFSPPSVRWHNAYSRRHRVTVNGARVYTSRGTHGLVSRFPSLPAAATASLG